ncbi:BNR-4 repeat-containing protein [Georgenia sp. H159]|uniref:BNR-4 repeat-containing protein n=1 Tax=Georgenia sp. H159 TaxID=3076115 RepID=UPI002D777B4A|nr:BNR-4 repeat-containing protein [Georgenia sp. H159]
MTLDRTLLRTVVRVAAVVAALAVAPAALPPAAADVSEPVGPIESWVFNNGSDSVGRTTSAQYQVGFNAVARDYANGRLYATPAGVHAVTGRMLEAFLRDGGHGELGYPTSALETTGGVGHQSFEFGALYISAAGEFSVKGPLYAAFVARGGVDGLGVPIGPESIEGTRRTQRFDRETLSVSVGNGQDSLGVRRGSTYYLKNEISPGEAHGVVAYGRAQDTVLVGDWDGDGVDTLAVRRGNVYYFKNSISDGAADEVVVYGRPQDTVLVGDWDGDGVDTLAVRRGSEYHVKNSITAGVADRVVVYGRPDDEAYPGDWFGTGADTIAIRRGSEFHFKRTVTGGPADVVTSYGRPADVVLVGDWDADGTDTVTVRRGSTYHVKNSLGGGPADLVTDYGRATDHVLVGDWDGRARTLAHRPGRATPVVAAQDAGTLVPLTAAWANNSVNTTAFRKSSLVTAEAPDGTCRQYTAYFDAIGTLVLAHRDRDGGAWEYSWSQYTGNVTDAHNSISLTVDGDGYLHVSWGQHNSRLTYARSVEPFSLDLGPTRTMVPRRGLEGVVTYPEFFRLPDGNLFFLYRHGSSGDGNVVLNRYVTREQRWERVHDNLIAGEAKRSAYWQAAVDSEGRLHLSWTWRRTADVATNHDVAYARSTDATGRQWERTSGERYTVPIRKTDAEYAEIVPEGSDLMNQTSMTVDAEGNPYVASYWDSGHGVQYQVLRSVEPGVWERRESDFRVTDFSLSGGGTKSVPIARPQILVTGSGEAAQAHLLIRDVDRGSVATLATLTDWAEQTWEVRDLTTSPLGEWEPGYDLDLWRSRGILDVFVQNVRQIDGEGLASHPPQYVYVLQVSPGLVALRPTLPTEVEEPTSPPVGAEPTPPVEESTPPAHGEPTTPADDPPPPVAEQEGPVAEQEGPVEEPTAEPTPTPSVTSTR